MTTLKNSYRAATSANISAATMIRTSSKSCNHLPRKRRRHFSELHLMLMIFIVFSSCLVMGPLETMAASAMQDYGSVTAKGENIFMVATNGNSNSNSNGNGNNDDDDLGNALPYELAADEQEEDDEGEGLGDATNDAGDGNVPLMANVKKEHAATEDIEMMQPPHNMRHQEHYKSRLIQHQHLGLNDFKPPQQPEKDVFLSNRHLRYQQIQQALREPVTPLPPQQQKPQQRHHRHHHEHHNHQRHHLARQEELRWPPLQHSRHQHHQDHLHHHRGHNFSGSTTTTTTSTTTIRPRYFDRDGLYTNPLTWLPSTQGPLHLEEHMPASKLHYNSHNRLFKDDDMDEENKMDNEEDNEKEFKRISLSLDANKESPGNDKLFDTSSFDNDDDDYSYEDEEDNNEEKNAAPSLAATAKSNVKRYTNPSRTSYKSPSASLANKRQHYAKFPPYDNDGEDYDGNDDRASHSPSSEASTSSDDNFSDEKWNKIEHEHYRKQMQHQRAMQALRSRRPSSAAATSQLDNTPNSITKSTKFAAAAAGSSKSATSAKRQIPNDDDADNIYSRYYVLGSVTRKKEEELGSPTAMLESRRQYAMQQRQNKALASAHHRRIVKEGTCRLPQPRVERIRRDSWKIYTPHCTILHRCADDTGCCPTERQTCAPKRTKNVDLYFFVISLNETQGSIERLTYVNHTECHCVDKSKQKPPEYITDDFAPGATDLSSNHIPFLRRATILNCNCPNLYEKILQEDGFCRCDCSSGNMGCDWLKRGMEHFSMNDRKCISEGRCKLPTCEYGAYMKKHGRCPRREERQLSVDTVDW